MTEHQAVVDLLWLLLGSAFVVVVGKGLYIVLRMLLEDGE